MTDTLEIKNFRDSDIQIQLINVFKNIKTLTLIGKFSVKSSALRINLPQLQSLIINEIRFLNNFSTLQKLYRI